MIPTFLSLSLSLSLPLPSSSSCRRRLHLTDTQSFYLIVNRRTMVSASMTLAEVYRADKDTDGFLYITYASQEMFG